MLKYSLIGWDTSELKPVERTTYALQVGSVKQEPVPNIGMHGIYCREDVTDYVR